MICLPNNNIYITIVKAELFCTTANKTEAIKAIPGFWKYSDEQIKKYVTFCNAKKGYYCSEAKLKAGLCICPTISKYTCKTDNDCTKDKWCGNSENIDMYCGNGRCKTK